MIIKKSFVVFLPFLLFFGFFIETSMAYNLNGCNYAVYQRENIIQQIAASKRVYCTRISYLPDQNGRSNNYFSQGGTRTAFVFLRPGTQYYLIGTGNEHARNFNMHLYAPNWGKAGRRRHSNRLNAPIIEINPRYSGNYTLRVNMYAGRGCANVMLCS
jgi:hypothetical protein